MASMPPLSVVTSYKISPDYRRSAGNPAALYSQVATQSDAPRAVVQIDKYRIIPTEFRIEKNAHGVSDSAMLTLGIAGNTDWSNTLSLDFKNGQIPVAISAGFPANLSPGSLDTSQMSKRFTGIIDDFEYDALADTCTMTCRSYGSILTDQKVTTASQNQTTTDFIAKMAAQFNLSVFIFLRPATKTAPAQIPNTLQTVYGRDFLVGLKNMRIWDIFVDCAEVDDVDVWVDGNTIYYVAPEFVIKSGLGHQASLTYGTDIKSLTGKHSPTFNKNIAVEVRTYSPRTRLAVSVHIDTDADGNPVKSSSSKVITTQAIFGQNASVSNSIGVDSSGKVTAGASYSSSSGGAFSTGFTGSYRESTKERYILRIGNLSQADADARALAYWRQLSRNEYSIAFRKAVTKANLADIGVTTRFVLSKCPWQQFNNTPKRPYFFPRRITETFSVSQGDGVSAGWEFETEAVSHVLSQGAV